MKITKKRKFLVTSVWPIYDEIEFNILETKAEEGADEFNDEIEEYEDNNNVVTVVELNDKVKKSVIDLADKFQQM